MSQRTLFLVASCQWCGATTTTASIEDVDELGSLVIEATGRQRLVGIRRAVPPGGPDVRPCQCRPDMPGPIPAGD